MQNWEYGVILGFTGFPGYLKNENEAATDFRTYKPCFYRLTAQGAEMVTDFSKRPRGVSEADAVAQLIAQLGDEGWEMVGSGNLSVWIHSLHFKRPKP